MFSKEDCEYTKFNIENHKITFDSCDGETVLISVPFTEDTPQCLKAKLNDIIFTEMNKYLETVECMLNPCNLVLNARMQVQCYNDEEIDPHHYISITITDLIGGGTWIDKTVNIFSESSKFINEFKSYCQYQVNKILFLN